MLDTAERPPVTEVEPAPADEQERIDWLKTTERSASDGSTPDVVTPSFPSRTATLETAPALPTNVRLGIFGVAFAAAVLSFASLCSLAGRTGTWPWIAWLFPIALDAAAVASMTVWMRSNDQRIATYAGRLTWAAVVISVSCNGIEHGFTATGKPLLDVIIAIAVGSIPPIMFGAVVHLVVLTGGRHRWGGTADVDLAETPGACNSRSEDNRDTAHVLPADLDTATPLTHESDDTDTPSQTAVTTELRSVPSLPRDDEQPATEDEQRKCANPSCQKLLPRDSHPSRRTCASSCRQAVARHRKQEVTA